MESWLPRITNAVIPDSGIETLIPGLQSLLTTFELIIWLTNHKIKAAFRQATFYKQRHTCGNLSDCRKNETGYMNHRIFLTSKLHHKNRTNIMPHNS